jgi:hypothetical protein
VRQSHNCISKKNQDLALKEPASSTSATNC